MKLDREVRHQSEDIDDHVLVDAVKAIRRRVRTVNRDYDIPYIAGYSVDGRTVFIDRHLPRTFHWLGKVVRVNRSWSLMRSSRRRSWTNCVCTTFMPIKLPCVRSATP